MGIIICGTRRSNAFYLLYRCSPGFSYPHLSCNALYPPELLATIPGTLHFIAFLVSLGQWAFCAHPLTVPALFHAPAVFNRALDCVMAGPALDAVFWTLL
jgi:hypothetical protein